MSSPTILIPIVFPNPDFYPIRDRYLDGLNGFDIVLSGYWEVPENLTPEAAQESHQTEAEAILYDIAAEFSHAGAATDIQLQFGPAGAAERTYQMQVIADTGADGLLLADQLQSLHSIMVPLRDSRHQTQIIDLVSALDADSLFVLELYHVAADEAGVVPAEQMLHGVEETLLSRGFTEADLEVRVEVAQDAKAAIAATARDHHLVVMGETEQPGADDYLFGPVCTSVAAESETPIIVVQE